MRPWAGSRRTGGSGRSGSTSSTSTCAPSSEHLPGHGKETPMNDRTPDASELIYTRVFDAPRGLVFRCMLEPEHLTYFWGPAGMSTPLATIKVDPRPGAVFETVMVNAAAGSRY